MHNINVIFLYLLIFTYSTAFPAEFDFDEDEDEKEIVLRYALECRQEWKVNFADLEHLGNGNPPNNEIQNCFADCFYAKFGLIRNGTLTEDGWELVSDSKPGKQGMKFKLCRQIVNKIVDSKCGLIDGLMRCMKVWN